MKNNKIILCKEEVVLMAKKYMDEQLKFNGFEIKNVSMDYSAEMTIEFARPTDDVVEESLPKA